MSPEAKHLGEIYRQLAESEGGKHLVEWLQDSADEQRRNAVKLEPTQAWGRLQFADGLERVIEHLAQMQLLSTIGKRKLKD